MATVAAIQAVLDPTAGKHVANIAQSARVNATYDEHYVIGVTSPYQGKAGWIRTTSAASAATQGAAILAALPTL